MPLLAALNMELLLLLLSLVLLLLSKLTLLRRRSDCLFAFLEACSVELLDCLLH